MMAAWDGGAAAPIANTFLDEQMSDALASDIAVLRSAVELMDFDAAVTAAEQLLATLDATTI